MKQESNKHLGDDDKKSDVPYIIAALLVIVLLWMMINIVVSPYISIVRIAIVLGVVVGLVLAIQQIKRQGFHIETRMVPSWKKLYYSPIMYVLLTLVVNVASGMLTDPIAQSYRTAHGLPRVDLQGFDGIGVSILSMLLIIVNGVYLLGASIAAVIIRKPRVSRTLFNIAIVMMILSAFWVSYTYYQLVVNAPVDGYPQWNF